MKQSKFDRIKANLDSGMIAREDLVLMVEYIDSSWEIEKGITDFTLHNDTVMRFRAVAPKLLGWSEEEKRLSNE